MKLREADFMARLFVGIGIDGNLREKISSLQKNFDEFFYRKEIKLVAPENFHLTLKFLGEVHDSNVRELSERIRFAAGGWKKFRISLEGLSFFNSPEFVRVIFLDIRQGKENIIEIERGLNDLLRDVREEDYDPRPHITIARAGFLKEKERLLEKLKSLEKIAIGNMDVGEITLFKSMLAPGGPVYTELENFSLRE